MYSMMRGRGIFATCAMLLLLGGSVDGQEQARPNIIFILADDLGYGDLGCYGQEIIQTPNLDAMAASGMRFTQCYAGSTVCAPSRSSLMTGQHTGHTYVRGNKRVPLRPSDVTVAEVLKGAGYDTALIGKWGLGEPDSTGIPNRQGFDEFYGYLNQRHAHTYYPEYLWHNEERVRLEGNNEEKPNVAVDRAQYSHDLVTQEAFRYIREREENPFFLYLAYTIPHANNERGRELGDGMEVPEYGIYADKDWPNPQKGHAAMITRLDRDIGRLFEVLKEQGLDDNTMVIFTSDNGTHREGGADPEFFKSSGPLRGIKRALYDGGIRVPGIVRWPGVVPEGVVNDHVWAFWDFLPTAAQLAGVDAPDGIDGISFAPTLSARYGEQQEHDYLYWEFHEGDFLQGIRMGKWKAVQSRRRGTLELFDVETDIGEMNDVSDDYPSVLNRMKSLFISARTESEHWPTEAQ